MSSSGATAGRHLPRPNSRALLDIGIAAAAFVGSVTLLSHGGFAPLRPEPKELGVVALVLTACSTVPLVAWRRFPRGVFVVTATASVLLAALEYRIDLLLGPTAAVCLLAASRERDRPWTARNSATVAGLFAAYLGAAAVAQGAFPGWELLHSGSAWALAWFAGERTRLRRERITELRERAERIEREAERERVLAAAEERARIARDLHDSVGHAMSVIAVRAGAARLRHEQDPDRSLPALTAIEELARQTAQEIDQIIGTLRATGSANGGVEDPAGLASIDTLIDRHRAAGLEVTVDSAGTPRPVGGAVDQAVYRILQEALTNATRHGSGRARIELAFEDDAILLTVTNPVSADGTPRTGGGHGLVGMRERVSLLGGSLDADRANGRYRVRARIPYGGPRG
jgi:signal transduction histidine kinase